MHRRSLVSNRALAGELALVLAGFTAGCDDAASPVHVVDVDDGTYLRGVQVSKLAIEPGHEVARAELYLDGLRVAADELAPFELAWDTRGFGDGAHTLVARVYLAGETGGYLDGKTAMWIDNTAPQLGAIPSTAMRGTSFTITATDNLKLARVEISRGVEGEASVVVANDPFTFSWPWACGTTAIHVRAFDAAGGEVTADASVLSADPDDRDCDGYRAQTSAGDDCDDDNFSVHPGATEVPEGYDRDCDGQVAPLPGVDFDGDGVPSITDGGNDCNDRDPAIHGPDYSFKHVPINVDGVPVTWNTGEAVLTGYPSYWDVYLNRGGIIEQYHLGVDDGLVHRTQLATGANAGSIASYYVNRLAFGNGNQVEILERNPEGRWVPYAAIPASGPVGKLAFVSDWSGDYVAFQVGTQLWLASASGSSWTVELVADVEAPIQEVVSVSRNEGYSSIVIRSNQLGSLYSRDALGSPFTRSSVALEVPTSYISYYSQGTYQSVSVTARDEGNGSAIYNESSSAPLLHTSRRIAALFKLDERSLLVKYRDDGRAQVVTVGADGAKAHTVQDVAGMEDLNLPPWRATTNAVLLGQGAVHYLARTIPAAEDPANDGVDRDCDKLD